MNISRNTKRILMLSVASLLLLARPNPALAQFSQQGQKLVGTGAVENSLQGQSVSLSADGNTAIVGGYGDNGGVGAVWVWARSGGVWTQQGPKLVGLDAAGNANQGWSVFLSADGNTAIVGGSVDNGIFGAAWVWTRSGGVWTQDGPKLVGSGAVGNASAGFSVSLSADGNTAIIGRPGDNSNTGAAWVWTRNAGVWSQQGSKLVGSGAVGSALQGFSVSLSANGNTAIIGGPLDSGFAGAVWVWTRSGGVWTRQAKLVGSGAVGAAEQGISVSLSADGNTAIVGGPVDAGAVWVWTRSGGIWSQQGPKLVGSDIVGSAGQGNSVSLSADGNTAIVGGPGDKIRTGAAWIWRRSGEVWTQQGTKLVGSGAVGEAVQGVSVSVSADGNTAIVGAPRDNCYAGAAWVFVASPQPQEINWVLKSPANSPSPRSGHAMAYDANRDEIVLFGGPDAFGQAQGDTWVWDGTDWAKKTPIHTPPPRAGHAMAYDALRAEVVLFGGHSNASGVLGDMWLWNGTDWTQRSPPNKPPPLYVHAMAFDAARGEVVLFGGADAIGQIYGDTWVWNGTDWTRRSPVNSPSRRYEPTMAYDSARGRVVLFGGNAGAGSGYFGDTWVWDGTGWIEKRPAHSPPSRAGHAMAYDAARGQIVLHGGDVGVNEFRDDTWVWDGNDWMQKNPINNPSAVLFHAMAYHVSRAEVVLFGGYDFGLRALNSTWVFTDSAAVALPRTITQSPGLNYVAFEAEGPNVKIIPGTPTSFAITNDITASGRAALFASGVNQTVSPASFASYAIKFTMAGSYKVFFRWRANEDFTAADPITGNSYYAPKFFNASTNVNDYNVSSVNNTRIKPESHTYHVDEETTSLLEVTQAQVDAGVPLVFTIGTREAGFMLDRLVLTLDSNLTEAQFNAKLNSDFSTYEPGPTIALPPVTQTVTVGGNATFRVVATGASPLIYQWRKNGVNIPGATSPTLTFNSVSSSDSGNYSVVVSNPYGNIISASVRLNAYLPPQTPQPKPPTAIPTTQPAPITLTEKPRKPSSTQLKVFTEGGLIFRSKKTVVLTHGWLSDSGKWPASMADVLGKKYDVNVVAWDWAEDADSWLSYSKSRTCNQGEALGAELIFVLGANYDKPIHFIGHSLGTVVNCRAADFIHGDARSTRNASIRFNPQNTHMTLLDEAELSDVSLDAPALIFSVEAYADWINCGSAQVIPQRSAWVDNYITAVGFLQNNAANVLLWREINNPVGLHSYAHRWYSDSVANPLGGAPPDRMGHFWSFERDSMGSAARPEHDTYFLQSLDLIESTLTVRKITESFAQSFARGPLNRIAVYSTLQTYQLANSIGTKIVDVENKGLSYYENGIEHLGSFLADVAERVTPVNDGVVVIGSGNSTSPFVFQPVGDSPLQANWDLEWNLRALTPPQLKQGPRAAGDLESETNSSAYVWLPITVPSNATAMSFEYRITGAGTNEYFTMGISNRNYFTMEAMFVEDGQWNASGAIQASEYAGKTTRLFFSLNGDGRPNGTLGIRGVQFYGSSQPSLNVAVSNGQVILSWPVSSINWQLESTESLSASNQWSILTNIPAAVGYQLIVTNPVKTGIQFFRLRR